jgi:EAL domain-containing protein (putative c-di-GMP-specific phosphodiesterase class I)
MQLSRDHNSSIAGAQQAGFSDVVWEKPAVLPVAFVVEAQALGSANALWEALNGAIHCQTFATCAAFTAALAECTPDLVLVDVTTEGTSAVEVLHTLSKSAYPGMIQLISNPGVAMVEPIRQLAQLQSLRALPALTRPMDKAALRGALKDLNAKVSQTKAQPIRLDEAIRNGWVQFWYQPKIDIRKKSLAGLEAFVRIFHPHKGLLPPAAVLNNADDDSLTALLHHALIETQAAGAELSTLGVKLPISINSSLKSLQTLPTSQAFRERLATSGYLRSVIFDVSEEDITRHRSVIEGLGPFFRAAGIRLAIDNFSGRVLPRSTLQDLPIAELKLSPKYVAQCHSHATYGDVCKALIHLAHDLQSAAVAIGVETAAQAQALQQIGCDVGQGFLYGHPLPLDQLVAMIKQRATTQSGKITAPAA